jgi:Rrf2 family protein
VRGTHAGGRLRISARGEYAIRAVLDLALHHDRGLVPIQEIAERQRIPQRYLEQVLLALKRAGLLSSKRGAAGGYQLTRPPETVSVGDVLRAVEGGGGPFEPPGPHAEGTELAELWEEIAEAVSRVVDRLTFAELAARVRERLEGTRPMYHI